jgi:3-demethoxyubiquinol 3-hydroxylase
MRTLSKFDIFLSQIDDFASVLKSDIQASRPNPAQKIHNPAPLSDAERQLAGALMRVNHVGEICAQALYSGQALGARDAATREALEAAAKEERDHLAWCAERLEALNARQSALNPLWYAASFALGYAASRAGDAMSLGFVVETEAQVEAHLASHLERLPAADAQSRAVVLQMQADEIRHGQEAQAQGAQTLPAPLKFAMKMSSKVMTTLAHRI